MKTRLFILLLMIGISFSCDKTVFNPIPNATVLLDIHLDTDAYDMKLKASNSSQVYDKSVQNPNRVFKSIERTGYGGIIVFHGQENGADAFFAYDMSCPNEASPSIKVAVENTLFARCPKCKTKYEIWSGIGNPVEGPSKYSLKRYLNVTVNGNSITIYNQ